MAYEPTKGFRNIVRALWPGDRVEVTGSYKNGSINMEKLCIIALAPARTTRTTPMSGLRRPDDKCWYQQRVQVQALRGT